MARAASVKVSGLKEIDRALKGLGRDGAMRALKSATGKAATIISRAARDNARKVRDTGLLAKSMGKRTKTYKRTGTVAVVVGPRIEVQGVDSRGRKRWPHKYAHLVEYGTKPHTIQSDKNMPVNENENIFRRSVMHPGSPPRPLMRAALYSSRAHVLTKLKSEAWASIRKEVARNRARGAK